MAENLTSGPKKSPILRIESILHRRSTALLTFKDYLKKRIFEANEYYEKYEPFLDFKLK